MYCNVADRLFGILRLLEEEKKKPADYGGGMLLGHAEVQFLEAVARYPGENASAISARLGITKGAVTQMVSKLCRKDLIQDIRREDNKKERFFCLTPGGEEIIAAHQRHHRQANQQLCRFIATLDDQETDAVFRFLDCVRDCVPVCQFPCGCETAHAKNKEEIHHEATAAACTRPACGT